MKHIVLIFLIAIMPGVCRAQSHDAASSAPHEITLSATDVLKMTAAMIDRGDTNRATEILEKMPAFDNPILEIERRFLMGRTAAARGNTDAAIDIYRALLDTYPDLARVRFELAVCYMRLHQWRRADYQLRRAMAGDDLPDDARQAMNYLRYVVRQNKNWNIYFNIGAAPDNNINAGAGGEECVDTIFGPLCRQLPDPVSAVGFNMMLGGDYEFRLGDAWRWKSAANIYTNIYDKHDFDDLYISAMTGPRYIWPRGDVWIAAVATRRWYGWDRYNWAGGLRVDTNYDFTRKMSGHVSASIMQATFDQFGRILDGQTYDTNGRLVYSFDASKYIVLRGGIARDSAADPIYANWRPMGGIGFGVELPARFNLYLDTMAYLQYYDAPRWTVHNGQFDQITEHSFTHRYAASVSNSRLAVWNFVPTLTISYTRRNSNIWQREFDKWGAEISLQQRF